MKEKLINLIDDYFNPRSFRVMLYSKLERDLSKISIGNTFHEMIVDVLTQSEQEGWFDQLLVALTEFRPNNKDIQRLVQSIQRDMGNVDGDAEKRSESSNTNRPKLLFLASQPRDHFVLHLGKEIEKIREKSGGYFDIQTQWSLTVEKMIGALITERPQLVHYSGHGEHDGILVEDHAGMGKSIPNEALVRFFSQSFINEGVDCVVLNCCDSADYAQSISKHTGYAIGMSDKTRDDIARVFSQTFYQGLASDLSIIDSFSLASVSVDLEGLPDSDIPQLFHDGENIT